MVAFSPVRRFVIGSSAIFLFGLSASAQDIPPAAPSSSSQGIVTSLQPARRVPLEQTLAEIEALDAELVKKIEAFRSDVDEETKAGRIAGPIADSLRWSLHLAMPSSGVDFGTLISTSRLPAENTKIMDAVKKLETEWLAGQQKRSALLQTALTEARTRTSEVARTATKVEDINPLLTMVDRLQDTAQGHSTSAGKINSTASFSNLATFLKTLRLVLEAGREADAISLGTALSQLQSSSLGVRNAVNDADIQQRVQLATAPFQEASDDAQSALDKAFIEKKPAAELTTALTHYEEASERNQQVRSGLNTRGNRDSSMIPGIYRNLVGIATALQNNDFAQAHSLILNTRGSNLQPLGAVRAASYSTQVAEWEKALTELKLEASARRLRAVSAKMEGIKTPAELEALANELSTGTANRRDDQDDGLRGLSLQLNTLAALWNGCNPQMLRQSFADNSDARFAAELNKLRQRIERDVLAHSINVPELLKPPLADLPTDAALDKLATQFSTNHDWRRLLQVANARNPQSQHLLHSALEIDLASAARLHCRTEHGTR